MTKPDQHFPWTYDYCPYRTTGDNGEREIPCFEIVDSEGRRVALTFEDATLELQEADARLLAAAPKLLEALILARVQLGDYTDGDGAAKFHTINIVTAAIVMAKGGVS